MVVQKTPTVYPTPQVEECDESFERDIYARYDAGEITSYQMQEELGFVMPSDPGSEDGEVRGMCYYEDYEFVRDHHPAFQLQGSASSGDPRPFPQTTYIVDDSTLLNSARLPSHSTSITDSALYGPGTRILIQFR